MSAETEAELIDLPEQEERPKVKIFTPKLIILIILASYLVSQNVYNYVTRPPIPEAPKVEVDKEKEFWEMFHRFKNYLVVAVGGFIVFYFLRRANDEHEEEKYLKAKKIDEEIQEEKRKKLREREEKIIRKIEQEERLAEERQMRMAASNIKPEPAQSKEKEGKDKTE